MTATAATAIKRLLWDLKELASSPLEYVSAAPVSDDNVFEWHANLVGPADLDVAALRNVPWHFVLHFPQDYPARPPTVVLSTPMEGHPNVVRAQVTIGRGKNKRTEHAWTVCMDMFELAAASFVSEYCGGWSSAYTARSILMQLQAFLWHDKFLVKFSTPESASGLDTAMSLDACITQAHAFACHACPHCPDRIHPPLASSSTCGGVARMPSLPTVATTVLDMPHAVFAQLGQVRKRLHEVRVESEKQVQLSKVVCARGTQMRMGDGWVKVTKPSEAMLAAASPQAAAVAKAVGRSHGHGRDRVDEGYGGESDQEEDTKPVAAAAKPLVLAQDAIQAASVTKGRVLTLSSVANVRHVLPSKVPGGHIPLRIVRMPGSDSSLSSSTRPVPQPTIPSTSTSTSSSVAVVASADPKHAGRLGMLPVELLLQILTLPSLPLASLFVVGSTCRWLRQLSQTADIHRHYLSRRPIHSKIISTSVASDWRYMFLLEHNHAMRDLRCWYTRTPFDQTILGFPVEVTWNPRTKLVDYAMPTLAFLSSEAFTHVGVRHTPQDKRAFSHWMPVYLTQDHFERGLPDLKHFVAQLATPAGQPQEEFRPRMVLQVFPKLLNTCAVLLADKGVHASDAAIELYVQIHRLWVACMHQFGYIKLQAAVEQRIAEFLRHEGNRCKDAEPGLGEFMALLSVSEEYQWKHVANAVLQESADRSVLWMGKAFPDLVPKYHKVRAGQVKEPDQHLLKCALESTTVSRRLIAFHVLFLRFLRGVGGAGTGRRVRTVTEMALAADVLYGKPRAKDTLQLQAGIRTILDSTKTPHWGAAFKLMGVYPLSPMDTTRWLVGAVHNSLRKGYHRKGMDFSKVQARGVSKILKRGESYKVSGHLKGLTIEETWRYPGQCIFLDASCMVLDANGNLVAHVTYSNTSYASGAVSHSGDIVDYDLKQGTHKIDVKLDRLPPKVVHLAFFMSGWTTPLSAMVDSFIRLADADSPADEMCSYTLDGKETGESTSVLMAVLSRRRVEGPGGEKSGGWQLKATGVCGSGRVGSDGPMRAMAKTFVEHQ